MLSPEGLLEYGPLGLFLVAFFESTVFPIPPDVLLLPLCLMHPRLSWWFAFLTTSASVLGALAGYAVGRRAGRPVVERFVARETVDKVQGLFQKYGGWAVGVAAFTPLPYKVFTFGAGIFRVPLWSFALASTLGRSARFFLEGGMVFFLGERARTYLGRNFEVTTLALTGILLAAAAIYPKIDSYLRRKQVFERPGVSKARRVASVIGDKVRLVRNLGVRFSAGLAATALLLLLCVVYLGDLAGPERVALNRSLLPAYDWVYKVLRVGGTQWLWALWDSPWAWVALIGAGTFRWMMWYRRKRAGAYLRVSRAYRGLVKLGVLAGAAYLAELALGSYLSRVDGGLTILSGRAFITPFLVMFGTYLVSKGAPRYIQFPLLAVAALVSIGDSANLVFSNRMDAASAAASFVVSSLVMAICYTVLAIPEQSE